MPRRSLEDHGTWTVRMLWCYFLTSPSVYIPRRRQYLHLSWDEALFRPNPPSFSSSLDIRSIGAGLRVTVRDHPWGVARDMGRSQGNTSSRRLVRARFLNSTRLGVVFARNPISSSLPLSPTSPTHLSLFIPEHEERQRLNSTQLFVASFWSNETKASEHRSSWTPL